MIDREEDFDYAAAIRELEEIALKVEDPQTGIDDIGRYIARSRDLITACRSYLRGVREEMASMDA